MAFLCIPRKDKKKYGKAAGKNNPGSRDTFGTVMNDDRDHGSRRSAGEATTQLSLATPQAAKQAPHGRKNRRVEHGYAGITTPTRNRSRGSFYSAYTGSHDDGAPGGGSYGHRGGRRLGGGDFRAGSSVAGGRERGGRFDFDDSCMRTTEGMVLFWKGPACFAQWTPSRFELAGQLYCNVEQYMMASKAKIFGDRDALRKIMATSNPCEQKALGRQVSGFDAAKWDRIGYDVVVEGNLAKFKQNPSFRDKLLATGDRILAEASPYDIEWGIGLHAYHADALVQARWPGKNKLGEALMEVRRVLREEAYKQNGQEEEEEKGGHVLAVDNDWEMIDAFGDDDEDKRIGTERLSSRLFEQA